MVPTKNDHVLVTGAARGLGLATALGLAEAGFSAWAGLRNPASEPAVIAKAAERGLELHCVHLDVTDPATVDSAVETIQQAGGSFYGLVNNAGITGRSYFEHFPEDYLRKIFEVNVFGTMSVTKKVLPIMREQGRGRILMLSSVAGKFGSIALAPYVSSKFAVEGFGESLAIEMKPFGVDVVIIEPGITKTDIWDAENRVLSDAQNEESPYHDLFMRGEKLAEQLVRTSSIRPEDVGETVLHALTTDKPRYRYVVGWRARAAMRLRSYLPGELFEKIWFGTLLRKITKPGA